MENLFYMQALQYEQMRAMHFFRTSYPHTAEIENEKCTFRNRDGRELLTVDACHFVSHNMVHHIEHHGALPSVNLEEIDHYHTRFTFYTDDTDPYRSGKLNKTLFKKYISGVSQISEWLNCDMQILDMVKIR